MYSLTTRAGRICTSGLLVTSTVLMLTHTCGAAQENTTLSCKIKYRIEQQGGETGEIAKVPLDPKRHGPDLYTLALTRLNKGGPCR